MKGYGIIACSLAGLMASCGGDRAKVSGRFAGIDKQSVYLESVSPAGTRIVDSAKTDNKGNFTFKVKLDGGQEAIYNIRYREEAIPLLLAPGERVKVNSMGSLARNYTVEGSDGSDLMRELNLIMMSGASSLDSLTNRYARLDAGEDSVRREIASDYARQFYKTKREQIAFIVTHPQSLAAFYALYQRLPNDNALFNGEGDVVYFRMVADSIEKVSPGSAYLPALRRQIETMSAGISLQELLNSVENTQVSGFPDIELPDMYGQKVKLSSLTGKVILVDFWSAASNRSKLLNAELKETYEALKGKGFEVYQVSLDTSKPLWVTTVQDQKLPWVSVCDFRGEESAAARVYNVRSVPTNFLIDREGNLVARDLFGVSLTDKIKSLL